MNTERKERIELTDTGFDIITKMSEGNPGATTVLIQLLQKSSDIDPDSFMGSMSNILSLDSFGIYGSKIWVLYKDVCGENLVRMIAVLRATQLGMLDRGELKNQIELSFQNTLDVEGLYNKVKEYLPNFDPKK